jgi:hypothetical protein
MREKTFNLYKQLWKYFEWIILIKILQ